MTSPVKRRLLPPLPLDLILVFLTGVLLRVQYTVGTLPWVRGYDVRGHMEYVAYVFRTLRMPGDAMGWETHQPPLYYFLAAAIVKIDTLAGRFTPVWQDIQLLSLFFSILTLAAVVWMAIILFPKKSDATSSALFLGFLACLPGIVFLSSRVSNDTLATLILFVFLALLLAWWRKGQRKMWRLCCLVAAIGILTKVTTYIAFPVLLFCLWRRRGIRRNERWRLFAEAAGIGLLIGGWFVALRFSQSYFPHLLDTTWNLGLNKKLLLPIRPGDLLSFSPVRVLEIPFNSPWSDAYGRRYFWEYLFKSAFFGEWQMPNLLLLCRSILAGGLGVLILGGIGIVHDVRQRARFVLPLLTMFIAALLVLFCSRVIHSSIPNQDFRLMPILAVPFAAFVSHGVACLSPRWKMVATAWLVLFFVLCSALLFLLPL